MWNLNNHKSTETNLAFCWICAALFLDTKLVIFSCNRSLACYSVEKRANEQTNHLIGEILMTIIDIHLQYVNVEAQAKQDLCLPKGPLFYRVHLLFYWIPMKTTCTNLYLKKKENAGKLSKRTNSTHQLVRFIPHMCIYFRPFLTNPDT